MRAPAAVEAPSKGIASIFHSRRKVEGKAIPPEPDALQNATNHSDRTVFVGDETSSSDGEDHHTLGPGLSWIYLPAADNDDDNDSVVSELDTPELENIVNYNERPNERRKSSKSSVLKTEKQQQHRKSSKSSKRKNKSSPLEPLANDSRLLRATASRRASEKNGKQQQQQQKNNKEKVDVEEARRRARERVRVHKQKMKVKKEQERRRSQSLPRPTRMTAEDGRSRAQARVRLRELQEKALNASRHRSDSPDAGMKTAASKMKGGTTNHNDTDDHTVQSCTMDFIMKELSMDAQSCREYLLADDSTISSNATSKRPITVPNAPRFLLDKKYGDKGEKRREDALRRRSMNDDARSVSSFSTISTKRTLTTPQAPKFLLDEKYGQRQQQQQPSSPNPAETSMAETNHTFQNSLRAYDDDSSTWYEGRKTEPHAPNLSKSKPRELPKSTKQLELEMQEQAATKNRIIKSKPTKAEAPKFNSSRRRRSDTTTKRTGEQQQRQQETSNYQFRARPMPKFASKSASNLTQSRHRGRVAPSE